MASMPGIVIKIGVESANAIRNLDRVGKALDRQATRADKARLAWKKTAAGLATAGAAFAAVAASSVSAFMDDQKEVALLENTLQNLGFGTATADVNAFVDSLQFAVNVSESELRPALSTLLRATSDVGTAQGALSTAVDVSAGSGLDLATVSDVLAKAYAGNRKGLKSLKSGLDGTFLATASMEQVTAALADRFGGAGATRAGTLSGSLTGVQVGVEAVQEAFGKGLLGGGGVESLQQTEDQLRSMQGSVENLGTTINGLGQIGIATFDVVRGSIIEMAYGVSEAINGTYDRWVEIADKLNIISDDEADRERATQAAIHAAQETAYYESLLGTTFSQTAAAAANAAAGVNAHAAALDNLASSQSKLMSLGDPYTSANYFGGTPTSGYDRSHTVLSILESRKAAAAKRAAARAKKKDSRVNAVTLANTVQDSARRAASRTGAHYSSIAPNGKRVC